MASIISYQIRKIKVGMRVEGGAWVRGVLKREVEANSRKTAEGVAYPAIIQPALDKLGLSADSKICPVIAV